MTLVKWYNIGVYDLVTSCPSRKNLLTVTEENSTSQIADVLVEDQLQPPLYLVTVSQEQELYKPNSRTLQIIHSVWEEAVIDDEFQGRFHRFYGVQVRMPI